MRLRSSCWRSGVCQQHTAADEEVDVWHFPALVQQHLACSSSSSRVGSHINTACTLATNMAQPNYLWLKVTEIPCTVIRMWWHSGQLQGKCTPAAGS
jgi:hypothetical protein